MTLKLDQMLANLIGKEARVSHLDGIGIFVGKTSKLKENVKSEIKEAYGESYLNDADYVVILNGSRIDGRKKSTAKLFNLIDRALGETANLLAMSDFDFIHEKPEDDEAEGSVKYAFVKITLN